jgi:hypothetical protein
MHTIANTTLSRDDYLVALRSDFARFRALVWPHNVSVPSCPGWKTYDLAKHVADVYWHKSYVLRTGERPESNEFIPALDFDEAPQVYLDGAFNAVISALDPALPSHKQVWTFDEATSSVDFWFRRMAHETMIHRFDAELAAHESTEFDDALALDGVDEILSWVSMLSGSDDLQIPDVGVVAVTARTATRTTHYRLTLQPGVSTVSSSSEPVRDAVTGIDGDAVYVNLLLWGRMPITNPRVIIWGDGAQEMMTALAPLAQ